MEPNVSPMGAMTPETSDPQARIDAIKAALGQLDQADMQDAQAQAAQMPPAQDLTPVIEAAQVMSEGVMAMQAGIASLEQTLGFMATDISSSVDRIAQQVASISMDEAKSEPIEIKELTTLSRQLSSLEKTLSMLPEKMKEDSGDDKVDMSPVVSGLKKVQDAVEGIRMFKPGNGGGSTGTTAMAFLGAAGTGLAPVSSTNPLPVTAGASSATGSTQSSVAGSTSSVTILASNASRKGATIVNESSAVLYLKLGSSASTSSYSVAMAGSASAPYAYFEVPYSYIGDIHGVWASATGNARITELTA